MIIRTFILFAMGCLVACSSVSKRQFTRTFLSAEEKFHDHIGFVLYDVESKKTLYEFNGPQYFTPASNTKIFTFYTSLKILGDSVPGLRYIVNDDSVIFQGTGDPSLLNRKVFTNNRIFQFLKDAPHQLYFTTSNFNTTHFGSGWAWDDYNDYYSAERSALPLYGNLFSVYAHRDTLLVSPSYFRSQLTIGEKTDKPKVIRQSTSNQSVYYPSQQNRKLDVDIPYTVDGQTIAQLLADTLNRSVTWIDKRLPSLNQTLYSIPTDSLYKVMMQESDNFIAEQLLLISAAEISDTLQPEIAIRFAKKNFLADLEDEPIWVDGSGLSRYNLFTPRSIVQLWEKIYNTVPRERLFPLLAAGGKNGTVKNWYKKDKPFIFGKTGSLSNNHCLSGYLVTRRGKVLIFSYMNSNFVQSTNAIRKEMEKTLNLIYDRY